MVSQARNQHEQAGSKVTYQTTRRFNPEDSALHCHDCENIQFVNYIKYVVSTFREVISIKFSAFFKMEESVNIYFGERQDSLGGSTKPNVEPYTPRVLRVG
jgi:hypothetical protein